MRGFWMTNHVANSILRPMLRGPLGRRMGRRLAVMRYRGRRSGQMHEVVVQYARDGDHVVIVPGNADRKQWWRNMREALPVELWLAGSHVSGMATAISSRDGPAEVAHAMAAYRAVFRRARETSASTVVVRIELAATPA
jgi:F420H(2)-dependent quinone reductase